MSEATLKTALISASEMTKTAKSVVLSRESDFVTRMLVHIMGAIMEESSKGNYRLKVTFQDTAESTLDTIVVLLTELGYTISNVGDSEVMVTWNGSR